MILSHINKLELRNYLTNRFFRNTYLMIISSLATASGGFIFWIIAAKLYSTSDIGLASAIISATGLISLFSTLGFGITLIVRLSNSKQKNDLINTCLTISCIISSILSLIFIVIAFNFFDLLMTLKKVEFISIFFIISTVSLTLNTLQQEGIFVGFRKPEYSLKQTIILFTRIAIVPFLAPFGGLGIFVSYGFTSILAFIFGLHYIKKIIPNYTLNFVIKRDVFSDIFKISFGNYLVKLFEMTPPLLLPILILNRSGPESSAYFYISWQISTLIRIVPSFAALSLLAEASDKLDNFGKNINKFMCFVTVSLIAEILAIIFFGRQVLYLFGHQYSSNCFEILLILSLASIPYMIISLYNTTKRVQGNVHDLIVINGFIAGTTIILSYLLLYRFGIIIIAVIWLIANTVVAIVIIFKNRRSNFRPI